MMRALTETRGLFAAALLCLLGVLAVAAYRGYVATHPSSLLAQPLHAPAIERLTQAGARLAATTGTAMAQGYNSLLTRLPQRLRSPLHALLCGLPLLLLAHTLLPGQRMLASAAWLAAVLGSNALGMTAWITTDPLGQGLAILALCLFASAEEDSDWSQALIVALAAAVCVAARSLYLPALTGLFLLGLLPLLRASRKAAVLGLIAMLAVSVPPWLGSHGFTLPVPGSWPTLDSYRSDLVPLLFWTGLLTPVLLIACIGHWARLQSLLPHAAVGVLITLGLLLPGLAVLQPGDAPGWLRIGWLLHLLDRLHPPPPVLQLLRMASVASAAALISYVLMRLWTSVPAAATTLLGTGLYLASLSVQPRPYQRYFELLLLFALIALLLGELSAKPRRYLPLLLLLAGYAAAFYFFVR